MVISVDRASKEH